MSNIIKGGRVSSQSIIDLSKRIEEQEIEPVILDVGTHHDELNTLYASAVQEKNKLIEEAKQEAVLILAKAKAQAAQEIDDAKEKAKEILTKSKEEASVRIEQAKEESVKIQMQALEEKQSTMREIAPKVAEIIAQLVSHIVHKAVLQDARWVEFVVAKMLLQEDLSEEVILRLSPDVYQKMTQEQKENLEALKVVFNPKQDLEETSIIIETSHGDIEYNIEDGLEQVIHQIKMFQDVGVADGDN